MIATGQGTATAVSSVLVTIPPGPCTLLLSNSGTASPVWIGAGGSVTASNGFPVPSGQPPVTIPGYASSGGSKLAVVTGGGTATVGWLLSTSTGGTGL